MSKSSVAEPFLEPERYELHEIGAAGLDRRQFFRIAGGGIVVALLLGERAFGQRPGRGPAGPREVGAWLHVGEDSGVTVYTGKVEIGQNIRTSLTQVVAEELHTPVERIRLVMADTALTPYDAGTFGSSTTPQMASQLRRVAAAAREELIGLAADEGKIDRAMLAIKDGKVVGPDGKPSFDFSELTKDKKLMRVVGEDDADHAGRQVDDGRHVRRQGGRPVVRHRPARVRIGREAAGDADRQGAAAAELQGDARFRQDGRRRGAAGRDRGARRRFRRRRGPQRACRVEDALAAVIRAEWKEHAAAVQRRAVQVSQRSRAPGGGGGGFGGDGDARGSVEGTG